MKILIDENTNVKVKDTLAGFFPTFRFVNVIDCGWSGLPDIEIFEKMSEHGFEAILTRDKNQLRNLDERNDLVRRQLHWIGHASREVGGLAGLALETSTILSGLPHVLLHEWDGPHSFHIKGVPGETGQRLRARPLTTIERGRE